ncbi:outer membrane protein [Bradyrhizobium prioriisuperbiae]|uniref:outer membrane protein n=1 Tax=Bradyrhizobium prioriisuperbiae TaxID=2854389 RepID=UPI0028F0AEBC|nr:outer membrane beta-barrel protein [Bradyrhizobium prioritasuperba]
MRFKTVRLAAVLFSFGVASSASAADMAVKARPTAIAPLPSWTGFYAGLNAGGAFDHGSLATTGTPVSFNPAGLNIGAPATANALAAVLASNPSRSTGMFIGGGQFGYNFQFAPTFVLGFETDIQALAGSGGDSNFSTTSSFAPFGFPANSYSSSASFTQRLDYLGTVRGRIGYLATPSLLTYATGGLAYGGAHVSSSYSIQQTFPGWNTSLVPPIFGGASASNTAVGWTVGGGLEWMFGSNWSAKFEYLYYDLGSVTATAPLTQNINVSTPWATALAQTSARFNGSIARVGVNYHFN